MLTGKDYSVVRNAVGQLAILMDGTKLTIKEDDDVEIVGRVMKLGGIPIIGDLPDSVVFDKRSGKDVEIYAFGLKGEMNAWKA